MRFKKSIRAIWKNIMRNQNKEFHTLSGVPYSYVIYDDYLLINNDTKRMITKEQLKKALLIDNPSPSRIQEQGIFGPSYVYGIITDRRIMA